MELYLGNQKKKFFFNGQVYNIQIGTKIKKPQLLTRDDLILLDLDNLLIKVQEE